MNVKSGSLKLDNATVAQPYDVLIDVLHLLPGQPDFYSSDKPQFVIVHRFQQAGTECLAGEEIAFVGLFYKGRMYWLRLPLALRLLFDYLARHRWLPQSASQIEAGMNSDAFCVRHGTNVRTSRRQTRKVSRSAVKEYVKRIREALRIAFDEAGLELQPTDVLLSERTVGNEVGYRWKLPVRWIHLG